MSSNFDRVKVGDLVWSVYYGCGEVKSLDQYNFKVHFPVKEEEVAFDYMGCQQIRCGYDKTQTVSLVSDILAHLPKKLDRCEEEVTNLKKGDIVYVRDVDNVDFQVGVFIGYSGDIKLPYTAVTVEREKNWTYCIPYKGHEGMAFGEE